MRSPFYVLFHPVCLIKLGTKFGLESKTVLLKNEYLISIILPWLNFMEAYVKFIWRIKSSKERGGKKCGFGVSEE